MKSAKKKLNIKSDARECRDRQIGILLLLITCEGLKLLLFNVYIRALILPPTAVIIQARSLALCAYTIIYPARFIVTKRIAVLVKVKMNDITAALRDLLLANYYFIALRRPYVKTSYFRTVCYLLLPPKFYVHT